MTGFVFCSQSENGTRWNIEISANEITFWTWLSSRVPLMFGAGFFFYIVTWVGVALQGSCPDRQAVQPSMVREKGRENCNTNLSTLHIFSSPLPSRLSVRISATNCLDSVEKSRVEGARKMGWKGEISINECRVARKKQASLRSGMMYFVTI